MRNKNNHINLAFKSALIVLIFTCFTRISAAQVIENSYIKDFKASYENERIYLSWTTKAGFMCEDIRIQLSPDTTSIFQTVGTIYGVCGSEDKEENYFYVLDNPYTNITNYLRLELGNLGYSATINVFAFAPRNEIVITPHPIQNEGHMQLDNKSNEELQIQFFTKSGQLLQEIYSDESKIFMDVTSFSSGVVLYTIRGDQFGIVRGKMIKQP